MAYRCAAWLALVLGLAACGGGGNGGSQPPPGAPTVVLIGRWPDNGLGRELARRVFTEDLTTDLPVLINAAELSALDAATRQALQEIYDDGQPVGVLDATQAQIDALAALLGRQHGVVAGSARTPLAMLSWRAGRSRYDYVLRTVSQGSELDREVEAFLDWLPPQGEATLAAAGGPAGAAACPDPENLYCLMDQPQQIDTWSDCVATWNVQTTQFAYYNCAQDLYYVGLTFFWSGTVPSGYSWSEVVVPGVDFSPLPGSLSLVSSTPESSATTTTVTTGTELMIGGGASFGASSDGPMGSLSFAVSDTFVNETTTEVLSTDVQNLSSTENGTGDVLYQYQNFNDQCPGPYCYWAGNAPTCSHVQNECGSGFTSAINIQCDGNYPYECEYGFSQSDNTGGCGDECDRVGSGKNLCCPPKSEVQNCFTSQTAGFIWTFAPSDAASCPGPITISASFRDDWPPVCSPSSPTTTDQGQCGPTWTNQYNTYALSYIVDIPAQCCSSACAAPPPTPGAPTPTPVPNPTPSGSWSQSCSQTYWDGTTLCASCENDSATCVPATCVSDCDSASNIDGVLTCGS